MEVTASTERVWRIVVGSHDADAIANHASNNSDTGERVPIERSARTAATS